MRLDRTFKEMTNRICRKKRFGPVSLPHRQLVSDITRIRNKIIEEPNEQIRSFLQHALSLNHISSSQIFQDTFVLFALDGKRNGFFCDFGATDGVFLSNSYMLEKYQGWKGICAEPGLSWHSELHRNRPSASIETHCVWSRTGDKLTFTETKSRELSTISQFEDSDGRARRRQSAATYEVETISLNDMLEKHDAPADLDYLSMDTEGSELDILKAFDFKKFRPKVMTIEHNYTSSRAIIHDILAANGYERVLTEVSLFDDWYVDKSIETIFRR